MLNISSKIMNVWLAIALFKKGDTLTLFGSYKNIKLLFKNDEKDKA